MNTNFANFLLFLLTIIYSSNLYAASTYYEILGVPKNATLDDIKKARKELLLQYHPDRNPSEEALEMSKLINQAYEVLSDSERRQRYDLYGDTKAPRKSYQSSTPASEHYADQMGAKYSNEVWKYDSEKKAFFDKRTRIWSYYLAGEAGRSSGFYVHGGVRKAGWKFNLETGEYIDDFIAARWDPSLKGQRWYRWVSSSKPKLEINAETGFPKGFNYSPKTKTAESSLIDSFLNPKNRRRDEINRPLNQRLKRDILALEWTQKLMEDFLERWHLHVEFFHNIQDFRPSSEYMLAFMDALIDNPIVKSSNDLMHEFQRGLNHKQTRYLMAELSQERWWGEPHFSFWISDIHRSHPLVNLVEHFRFSIEPNDKKIKKMEKILSVIPPGELRYSEQKTLWGGIIDYLKQGGKEKDGAAISRLIKRIIKRGDFYRFIARIERYNTRFGYDIVELINEYDSAVAKAMSDALKIPAPNKDQFIMSTMNRESAIKAFERAIEKVEEKRLKVLAEHLELEVVGVSPLKCAN